MTLDVAGQWATVLSPLVATVVFVTTVVLDRRRHQRERYASALDAARIEVVRAVYWAGLPGSIHVAAGGGAVRTFNAVSSFVLCLPKRQGAVAEWLLQGVTNMTTANHAGDRTTAQKQIVGFLVMLTPANRSAFKAATEHVGRNPWAEVEAGTPVWLTRALEPIYWLLRLVFGDPTYGTAREPAA